MDDFAQLASLHDSPDFPTKTFISVTRHAIQSTNSSLVSVLATNLDLNSLEVLNDVTLFVIETSFPLLASQSDGQPLGLLLKQVSQCILIPIIHSFFKLSVASLQYILQPSERSSDDPGSAKTQLAKPALFVDARPSTMAYFRNVLSCLTTSGHELDALPGDDYLSDLLFVRDLLMLETIRHLRWILNADHSILTSLEDTNKSLDIGLTNHNETTRFKLDKSGRVLRLAVKDAVWYLCSVLHSLVGIEDSCPSRLAKDAVDLDLAKQAILQNLFDLLVNVKIESFTSNFAENPGKVGRLNGALPPNAVGVQPASSDTSKCPGVNDGVKASACSSGGKFDTHYRSACDNIEQGDGYKEQSHHAHAMGALADEKRARSNAERYVLDDMERGTLMCVIERYASRKDS
ncbi:hypothetical protein B0H34DRAFT_57390 [Crassisporium funariophilum]|nr:hypothetical protein B0H34DRAFT_57390 [Crassisporium funariophilum]